MEKFNTNNSIFTHTELGTINRDKEYNETESTVEVSETNFNLLLSLVNRKPFNIQDAINNAKDRLTKFMYSDEDFPKDRETLINVLKNIIEEHQFFADCKNYEQQFEPLEVLK